MNKSLPLRIARRIVVRLARAGNQPLTTASVYRAADTLLSWSRERREAWIEPRYDMIKRAAQVDEVSLARFVTGIDYHQY
jgi:hypothetical protein